MSDMDTGAVTFVGPACMPLIGTTLIQGLDPETLDGVLKAIGYQPTKATKDARKAEAEAEFDPTRTIAAVVESAPRIDTGESVQRQDDSQIDPQSDLSTITDTDEGRDELADRAPEHAPEYEHGDGDTVDDRPPF